ncbi:MAG: UvrD-helicase domain-containing protein [Planctomycetota bacterium]
MDLLADLNEAQRAAVQYGKGPLLVVAGAGSGKTRVVTRRIARLLRDGEDPRSVLALTFTNKAAGEMARRVNEVGGRQVRVATFHSACARFLREDGHHLGYARNFTIYDTYDRDSCLKTLMADLGIRTKLTPGEVGRHVSRLKNLGVRAEGFRVEQSEIDAVVQRIYVEYERRMRAQAAMDFDDLLLVFLDLLQQVPAVAEAYQQHYRWLLVDEFQDTNRVQYAIVRILAGNGDRNLCVVGDPDQSIYRFRGAELGNLLGFVDDFPEAKVIRLEDNYRSSACILRAAQAVIERNVGRLDKALRPTRDEGERIGLHVADSADAEARFVCQAVAARIREGESPSEMAVFYRAHHLSRQFEEQFRRAGIDYRLVGGITFYERREIKDLLAYLRVATNPLDDVSMQRVVNVPPRGIGSATLAALRAKAQAEGMSLAELIVEPELCAGQKPKVRGELARLGAAIEAARAAPTARQALDAILLGTGYVEYATSLGDLADYSREENIQELVNDAANFDASDPQGGVAGWLQFVALLTAEDLVGDKPAVSLMTVHAAKGLEFEHIWLTGLEEGVFPHARSLGDEDEMEEERRLMYVAMTRAKTSLCLTRARVRMRAGALERQKSSVFFSEIPDDCIAAAALMRQGIRSRGASFEAAAFADELPGEDTSFDIDELAVERVDGESLRAGTEVVHPMYGRGTVVHTSGRGIQAKALVRFADGAERNLLLEYANLRLHASEHDS